MIHQIKLLCIFSLFLLSLLVVHASAVNAEENHVNTFINPTGKVLVGVYINGIHSIDLKAGTVSYDMYVWFRTKGKRNLLDSVEVMNGNVIDKSSISKEKIGKENYYSMRMQLNTFQKFNFKKFPLDTQNLRLIIEDTEEDIDSLNFDLDKTNSKKSQNISIPGWKVGDMRMKVEKHVYDTNYGDTTLGKDTSTFSSVVIDIPIQRDGLGYFFKLLGTVFLSAAVAFLCFFIKPDNHDPRFGLGVGGIFAVVASNFVLSSMLPETSEVTMGETLLLMTMAFIFISILESVISLKIFEKDNINASKRLDLIFGICMPIIYLILVSWIVISYISI